MDKGININNLVGKYSYNDISSGSFTTDFVLDIYEDDIKIKFKLEMDINGSFGKVGRSWTGICIERDNYVAMIAELEVDWAYTIIDNKRVESEKEIFETLPLEIYLKDNKITINILTAGKNICFEKNI